MSLQMDGLCVEILQIILNELDDPTNFSLLSKQYYAFTQDPYVRASYFLQRYGPIQALYWALGRGRLMNEQVIDTLLSSGAHLSRYLAQCAMHHYYRTAQVPFVKTPWARSMNLRVFTHFQTVAVQRYGNIPLGKGDDDAALFDNIIKESRFPIESRSTKWETLKDVLEKYGFIPFCNKDAMMANFPLALSIEPSLLPYARANGFHMDHKYRDFVFRKMFEKPAIAFEARADEIVRNVQELTRLDHRMFLSRTVTAEICLEVKQNEAAYAALKRLDKEGMLKFELSSVVIDLIKTYVNTRSITHANSISALRQLYLDFPTSDPVVRQVLLLQVFLSHLNRTGATFPTTSILSHKQYVQTCKETIESIGLAPVKRIDLLEVLSSSFAPEPLDGIIEYGRTVLDMSPGEIESLVQEVAFRCLENGCKGKMLGQLKEAYPFLVNAIRERVVGKYKLGLDDLPPWRDEAACNAFEAPLSRDYMQPRRCTADTVGEARRVCSKVVAQFPQAAAQIPQAVGGDSTADSASDRIRIADGKMRVPAADVPREEDEDLGTIGQDTLSTMIRKDELAPARGRRRFYDPFASLNESQGKLPYPIDSSSVGRWIHTTYGPRNAVTAIFMLHGVLNGSPSIVQRHLGFMELFSAPDRVPVTLKHFKMLACLGRTPATLLFDEIESGADFYFSEEDYLSSQELDGFPPRCSSKRKRPIMRSTCLSEYVIKTEHSTPSSDVPVAGPSSIFLESAPRPRRGIASPAKNYTIPDSDDDMIADEEEDEVMKEVHTIVKRRKAESNLQKWIKHLTPLLKEEQKKYKERRKAAQGLTDASVKVKVPKTEFHRVLATQLTRLRKVDKDKRQQLYGADCPEHDYSSGEEDEYHARPAKRRNVEL